MEKKDRRLGLTEAARDHIADQGYDPDYGARSLRRYIQSHVESVPARHILKTNPLPGTTLTVDCREGELVIAE
jgi:ATP-dependent Clp protease ATP-binding subunit ClpB